MQDKVKVFFSNSLDEIEEICEVLKKEEIKYHVDTSNNHSPIFGTNLTIGIQDICYKYSILVDDKDSDMAFNYINTHFPE